MHVVKGLATHAQHAMEAGVEGLLDYFRGGGQLDGVAA